MQDKTVMKELFHCVKIDTLQKLNKLFYTRILY